MRIANTFLNPIVLIVSYGFILRFEFDDRYEFGVVQISICQTLVVGILANYDIPVLSCSKERRQVRSVGSQLAASVDVIAIDPYLFQFVDNDVTKSVHGVAAQIVVSCSSLCSFNAGSVVL